MQINCSAGLLAKAAVLLVLIGMVLGMLITQ
ncbi:hypothetical protein EV192_10323 [Actinocrispum wychmicini]|uniref:Uncharacterized protein n=1 Tax=Actinocrispum wychmicini TaxID=1213861 RepID=A0A4R2JT57_9PSEU|nr:hypothetical protein EV192_10323 [Actinocrispum wychmicini]